MAILGRLSYAKNSRLKIGSSELSLRRLVVRDGGQRNCYKNGREMVGKNGWKGWLEGMVGRNGWKKWLGGIVGGNG